MSSKSNQQPSPTPAKAEQTSAPAESKSETPTAPAPATGSVVLGADSPVGQTVPLAEVAAAQAAKDPAEKPLWSESVQKLVDQLGSEGDVNAVHFFEALKVYMKKTAVDMFVPEGEGPYLSHGLYRDLQTVFNGDIKNFKLTFAAILAIFYEHRNGTLGASYINRWVLPGNEADTINFRFLMNLLMTTAEVKSRALSIKHLDLTRTLASDYYTELGRNRIKTFFA